VAEDEQTKAAGSTRDTAGDPPPTPMSTPPGVAADEPEAAPEPGVDAFAVYDRVNGAWTLHKTYTTQARGISAFSGAGLAKGADATRLVARTDGQAWPPTLYENELYGYEHIASMTR
jgi:hypothetical protein